MEIPYNEELRPDTGLYNAKLGIWIFLASEVMLFGGLFSAYILLRVGAPVWPPLGTAELSVPMALFNNTAATVESTPPESPKITFSSPTVSAICFTVSSTKESGVQFYWILAILIKKFSNIFFPSVVW